MPRTSTGEPRYYFKEVRFRQIRALVATAHHRSFAGAARTLGLATPSVWRQVRALEEEYGVRLVAARGQEVSLTEEGALLLELAEPLVEGFDSLKSVFEDRHGKLERQLRVATPATVLNRILPEVIADYRRLYPAVKLTLMDAPSRAAQELMEEGKADLAIVGHPQGSRLPPRFDAVPLAQYPFQLACPASHPLAGIKRLTLRELLKHPLVLTGEGSSSRLQFDAVVAAAGLTERVDLAMTASNLFVILNYVAMGMGVAILTLPAYEGVPLPQAGEPLAIRDISHLVGHERLVLLHPRGRHERPHVKAFRERVAGTMR